MIDPVTDIGDHVRLPKSGHSFMSTIITVRRFENL
jgi:hypothetical protein